MGCCKNSLSKQNELQTSHLDIKYQFSPNIHTMAPISCNLVKGDNDCVVELLDHLGSTCGDHGMFEKSLSNNMTKTHSLVIREEVIIDLRQAPSPSKQQRSSKNLNNKFIGML